MAEAAAMAPEDVRERVSALLADGALAQGTAAREAGISASALSQYLSGKYRGDVAAVEGKLARWLDARGERAEVRELVPEAPAFVETRSARDMMTCLRIAQSLEEMTSIAGVPGVGKSTTCREFRRRVPNVWIVTLASHTVGVVPVLKEICEAVGGGKATGANGLAREVVRKIRGTRGLLIIDECHHATAAALDAIRALHDATGVGVALVGAPEMSGKIERMSQLHSRIGLPLYLLKALREDVEALLDAWAVRDAATRRDLASIAKRPGALRSVTKVLRLATSLARGTNGQLQLPHIREAAQILTARTTHEEA